MRSNFCKECRKIDTEYLLDFVKILNGELSMVVAKNIEFK